MMGFVVKLNMNSKRDLMVTIIDQNAGKSVEKILLDVILPLNTDMKSTLVSDIDDYGDYDHLNDNTSFNCDEVYSSTKYIDDIAGEQEIHFLVNTENSTPPHPDDTYQEIVNLMDCANDNVNSDVVDEPSSVNGDHFKESLCPTLREINEYFEVNCPKTDQHRRQNERLLPSSKQSTDYIPRTKPLKPRFYKLETFSMSGYSKPMFGRMKRKRSLERSFLFKKRSRIYFRI